jgi:hypothetical protein
MSKLIRCLLALALLLPPAAGYGAPRTPDDIEVDVRKDGNLIRVDIELLVDAS